MIDPTGELAREFGAGEIELRDRMSAARSRDLGWLMIRSGAVVLLALVLYLVGGLGAGFAALLAGWFVFYR